MNSSNAAVLILVLLLSLLVSAILYLIVRVCQAAISRHDSGAVAAMRRVLARGYYPAAFRYAIVHLNYLPCFWTNRGEFPQSLRSGIQETIAEGRTFISLARQALQYMDNSPPANERRVLFEELVSVHENCWRMAENLLDGVPMNSGEQEWNDAGRKIKSLATRLIALSQDVKKA